MSKPALGSGGRFAAFVAHAESEGQSPAAAAAEAAAAGRKRYGSKRMAKMAEKGRKHKRPALKHYVRGG